jgi:hypothetical protein
MPIDKESARTSITSCGSFTLYPPDPSSFAQLLRMLEHVEGLLSTSLQLALFVDSYID